MVIRANRVDNHVRHRVLERRPADQHSAVLQHEFLHVKAQEPVEGVFIYLPQAADREGKAEGEQQRERRAQFDLDLLRIVHDVQEREPENAQHRLPLKVCRMVSQQGMMKKKLRTSPR